MLRRLEEAQPCVSSLQVRAQTTIRGRESRPQRSLSRCLWPLTLTVTLDFESFGITLVNTISVRGSEPCSTLGPREPLVHTE